MCSKCRSKKVASRLRKDKRVEYKCLSCDNEWVN